MLNEANTEGSVLIPVFHSVSVQCYHIAMKKNKKLIVSNWKMNPATLDEAKELCKKVSKVAGRLKNIESVICPPFVYLSSLGGKKSNLGAQDVFWRNAGSFTGEVSPEMLRDLGVTYCIIGHSERRTIGESDEVISKKVLAGLREGLKVILCIGEKERDVAGEYFEFLKTQLKQSLLGVERKYLSDLTIAYEPLWSIGKSFADAMKPVDIRETSIFIKKVLSDIYDQKVSSSVRIIYGGSVETENISSILGEGEVEGVLVGHKSLEADEFIELLKRANAV